MSPHTQKWELIDEIGFEVAGGRDEGFRGYTYKNKMMEGEWRVDVVTQEGLVLGIVKFEIKSDSTLMPQRLRSRLF